MAQVGDTGEVADGVSCLGEQVGPRQGDGLFHHLTLTVHASDLEDELQRKTLGFVSAEVLGDMRGRSDNAHGPLELSCGSDAVILSCVEEGDAAEVGEVDPVGS